MRFDWGRIGQSNGIAALASALISCLLIAQSAAEGPSPPRRPALTQRGICANHNTPAGVDRYCVSSVLPRDPNVNRFNYGPESLFDNADNTAWVEGGDGQGIGEWIVVEFDGLRLVKDIQIRNGYNKDQSIYEKNSRVKELRVEFSEREKKVAHLKDTPSQQSIELPTGKPLHAYWVKFTIESVYPEIKFEDTAISELHIVSEPIHP